MQSYAIGRHNLQTGQGAPSPFIHLVQYHGLPLSLACYVSCVADILLNNWNCVQQLDFCLYLQVIRPGTFTAQYIRSTGLKNPVLIKGDRFNESPQLGLMWPDVDNITVDILLHFIGGDRKASLTWSKQVTLLTKWHTVSCG